MTAPPGGTRGLVKVTEVTALKGVLGLRLTVAELGGAN